MRCISLIAFSRSPETIWKANLFVPVLLKQFYVFTSKEIFGTSLEGINGDISVVIKYISIYFELFFFLDFVNLSRDERTQHIWLFHFLNGQLLGRPTKSKRPSKILTILVNPVYKFIRNKNLVSCQLYRVHFRLSQVSGGIESSFG